MDVFYDSENLSDTNNIASYVYIKDYTEQADFGRHLFVIEDNYATEVGSGVWQMNVVVGNTERTIETTEAVKNILVNNVGKLYHAFWETDVTNPDYGQVTAVALVNEKVDGSHVGGYTGVCDYLVDDAYISGNTIVSDGVSYTVNSATTFITLDGTEVYYDLDTLEDALNDDTTGTIGVWVVDNRFDGNYNVASTVYVGTKLDDRTALNVTSATGGTVGDAEFAANNETATIEVDYAKGITQDTLTYTASDANSVLIVNGGTPVSNPTGTAAASSTDAVYSNNSSREVVVWNEAGTDSVTYTIVLNWYDLGTDATLDTVYLRNNNTTLPNWHSTAAKAVADPQGMKVVADSVEMKVTATDSNATVAIGRGTTVDLAVDDLTETDTIELSNTTDLSGGYVLIRITSEDGNNVSYYAYQIQ